MRRPDAKPTKPEPTVVRARIWVGIEAELVRGFPATELDLTAALLDAIERTADMPLRVLRSSTAANAGGWAEYRATGEIISATRL
jgi:hypothetical protein